MITERDARSLDGTWRFKLEQAPAPPRKLTADASPIPIESPARFEPFYLPDYVEESGWHDLAVPGNWEMAGHSPATYNNPDNASGFYRRWFEVPSAWQGRRIKIDFDGVQNGAEIWCNGRPAPVDESSWGRSNYHEGGWTAFQADVTEAVQFGQKNLLALRVTKNTRSVDLDSGDYFLLGGIYRTVTLFSVPMTYLADVTVRTSILADGRGEVRVITQVSGVAAGNRVLANLKGQRTVEAEVDAKGRAELIVMVERPRLWSAEFPHLYELALDVQSPGGEVTQRTVRKIGIREVTIQRGVLLVNGVPVKLAGICRHDIHPDMGTAVNETLWRQDLTLMKAANFNAIRTSHYPYGSGFYDLCDEIGFYVVNELAYCWCERECEDPAMIPAFEQRARETVRRDKNHACVIVWAIGNENKNVTNELRAAKLVGAMDPTRPRLVSWLAADAAGADVEIDDAHYWTPAKVRQAAGQTRRGRYPLMLSENPNVWDVQNGADYGCLETWSAVFHGAWKVIWEFDSICGNFLWEWQDRAVADKCPTKFYTYFPDTGVSLIKVKGVVDGWRNVRPEYFHLKMVQAPIVLEGPVGVSGNVISLAAVNRYSFTNLSHMGLRWELLRADTKVMSGELRADLAARSRGTVRLQLPGEALARADAIRVEVEHPGGWNVGTWQFALGNPVAALPPVLKRGPGLMFPRFNLVIAQIIPDNLGWRTVQRARGRLANVRMQLTGAMKLRTAVTPEELQAVPLDGVRTIEADVMLDEGHSGPVGRLRAEWSGGGFSYQVDWTAVNQHPVQKNDLDATPGTFDVQELGWIFSLPPSCKQFSWKRQALWSWYPPTHIGRPTGTARPDSMNVPLTRITRLDAFDFNSTKQDCDWACLNDGDQAGLVVYFDPEQRHHVRGGIGDDGACHLVVNRQTSPPRDLCSDCVKDLYLELTEGVQVHGHFRLDPHTP